MSALHRYTSSGSPPRMRGKVERAVERHADMRITPAHAGKRQDQFSFVSTPRDHPRACGEKQTLLSTVLIQCGSPPRMRGKVGERGVRDPDERITPAHAGKSPSRRSRPARSQDHPRACGEKQGAVQAIACESGSPPRMRGKVGRGDLVERVQRITPAHAGKRAFFIIRTDLRRDHPRACGEKTATLSEQTAAAGSPPRMRGKVIGLSKLLLTIRITPAHAGKRARR